MRVPDLPGCIGFVDGTLLPLENKPCKHGEDYYTRKSIHAINGRFQSLKAIRYRLADRKSMVKILRFISAAIIVHNILVAVKIPEGWMAADSECDEEDDEPGNAWSDGQALVALGQARRDQLHKFM
ncbi:hypothetical protein ACHHYP_20863 [Achlya hypogyna]|uniref:DDE Tnp4 domain-containing protein n=1 Tax=Achlya hypogyna TaxID=1202772 RepID=A0A1V9Y4P6_ACHHY|nr:hypothetical protein ACHHYP_20863 [Achlya hypogyna]